MPPVSHLGELLNKVPPQRAAQVDGGIGLLERDAQHPLPPLLPNALVSGSRSFSAKRAASSEAYNACPG